MTSIVLLNTHVPSQMASDLTLAGFIVWKALSVSEVLHLCEHQDIDAVVIAPGVEDAEMIAVQTRRITVQLSESATAQEVVWELSQLFPSRGAAVQ